MALTWALPGLFDTLVHNSKHSRLKQAKIVYKGPYVNTRKKTDGPNAGEALRERLLVTTSKQTTPLLNMLELFTSCSKLPSIFIRIF